jgi:hypothetical protein
VSAEPDLAQWLRLREEADAAARADELVDMLRQLVDMRRQVGSGRPPLVVHDLGSGTGAMGRWLASQLPGPQHWVLYDRDQALLRRAAADAPRTAADGAPVTVATRQRDLATLTGADLAGAGLVTASALLDVLSGAEVARIAAACRHAGCPALLTLSVEGRVTLDPPDSLDAEIAAAFNAHQRRRVGDRHLLGPDAPDAAAGAFSRLGATVCERSTPWQLGPEQAALTAEWLRGWVAAACAQRPALADAAAGYLRRRLAAVSAGRLRVVVGHRDLLAWFRSASPSPSKRSESA